MAHATWQEKAAAKRAAQAKLIPDSLKLKNPPGDEVLDVSKFPFDSVLSAQDLEITNVKDVTTLLAKVAAGEWSATEVTRAFCDRALIVHQLVNCLTEIFVDQAMKRAAELDTYFAEHGRTIGPLHGLPISLKDQIDVAGQEMTMGYVGWLGNVSAKDAVVAERLLSQGAVIYVRTNVPQALMLGETVNNLFGQTDNPYNRRITCGGSSGGEGALIALRGSLLGVGSDVAGSIRIPAAFCGLYGLRPSYHRVPYAGTTNSLEGQEAIFSVLGPMSSTIDGLKLFMKVMADSKPWLYDPLALRLPWSESEYGLAEHGGGKKLCFAMMWDDGYVKPHPPYRRAMEKTKKALEAAGHAVVDWVPYQTERGCKIINDVFNADGGEDINTVCALSGEPRMGSVLDANAKPTSAFEFWGVARAKQLYIKDHLDHWNATAARSVMDRPVDAIIAPACAGAPQEHGKPQYPFYTALANLCDYSASAFPVLKVDPSIDVQEPAHEFRSDADKMVYDLYSDPEVYRGAPIGLQCIGRKNEEEAVIRMTEIIDRALKDAL